ncbi:MAG: apolipoprotein N-acyltransferase [Gammaproteobacteria bacterium]
MNGLQALRDDAEPAPQAPVKRPAALADRRVRLVLALAAGALLACAFEPLGWWPLAILCPAALIWLWQDAAPREAARLGFAFSAGTFAAGTYWLYISIHVFGQAPIWLAFIIMAALVAIMGLYYAALGYVVARWLPRTGALRWLVGIPAAWLLLEWFRGWFLSGFSWLSLGYSQTDTWLAGFAPIVGVYGISALLLLGAGALVTLVLGGARDRTAAAVVLIAPWLAGAALHRVEWTRASGPPVAVAILQGAIPQDMKWLDTNRDATLARYRELNTRALGTPLIVWPESAPPDVANNLVAYLRGVYADARASGSAVVLGVVRASDDLRDYYNSVLALSDTIGWYDKRHLVPFAEFFPVPPFVRSWLRLMSLPYADFTRGASDQPPLRAAGLSLATTICYEDAYGSSQLPVLREANVLVNVTNDAWFGRSTARHQHFQIARMRAIEARRYMIRAANDGLSAVIDPRGEVLAQAPEYQPTVLRGSVTPRRGLPPYAYAGNWAIILAALAGAALAFMARRVGMRDAESRPRPDR